MKANSTIKIKKKICKGCKKSRYIFSKGNCESCSKKSYGPIKRTNKPVNKVSKKRKREQSEYSKLRNKFLEEHVFCEARIPLSKKNICTIRSTTVHHKQGQTGKLYLDTEKWLGCCFNCHDWIEKNPNSAKELGFSLNRI